IGYLQPCGGGERAARVGARTLGGPPALAQCRRADDADHRLALIDEGDQGGPDRDAADKVLGAVDRVDDPAAGTVARTAEFLAQDGVAGTGPGKLAANGLFSGLVGIGDRGE